MSAAQRGRATALQVGRRRATGLLVVVAGVFVVATILEAHRPWLAWVQAAAVASLVGGLADWFAVTALLRRPLGLPIPHTAIVVERKDRFAETLGAFVQESFLTSAAVSERLRSADAVPRVARWLADRGHAAQLSARVADAAVSGAELFRGEDVHDVIVSLVRQQLAGVDLAAIAGRLLERATADGHHEAVLDQALRGLSRYLDQHRGELQGLVDVHSPWWVPDSVEQRMVERLIRRALGVLDAMADDRSHPLRVRLDEALVGFAEQLQRSPELRARGEQLKSRLLSQAELRSFAATLWDDTKVELRAQAAAPESQLRVRLADLVAQSGVRLRDDPALAAAATRSLDRVARTVLDGTGPELASLVSATIQRWDAGETSLRLELLLGPDLQYIRINGTVVGGLAGLCLHALSRLLA